jgi:hypothetical protein
MSMSDHFLRLANSECQRLRDDLAAAQEQIEEMKGAGDEFGRGYALGNRDGREYADEQIATLKAEVLRESTSRECVVTLAHEMQHKAEGKVAALKGEVAAEKLRADVADGSAGMAWDATLALKGENEKLRAYADHTYFCGAKRGEECDCGYSAALERKG